MRLPSWLSGNESACQCRGHRRCAADVTNGFKGLDLTDRVPDEVWTEVHDIVQETRIKTIPKKKKCKKAKWLSEEALKIAVKRR